MRKIKSREYEIKKVSILGIVFNILLMIIKFLIGIISKSQAMIADGLNSAGDIFASLMSFIGVKISSKPSDDDHPFGHGKAEYVFALLISVSMLVASATMIKSAIETIILNERLNFSIWLILVCVITIITKLLLYLYARSKAKKYNSILILASKEDHRNDIFLTTGTLLGIILSRFGLTFFDGIFGILTSIWIIIVGIKLFKSSYNVLIDTSIDDEKINEIIKEVESNEEVLHVDSVKSKPAGEKHVIILKISMDGNITLNESHKLAGAIKKVLIDRFDYILDVIVHVNPHD